MVMGVTISSIVRLVVVLNLDLACEVSKRTTIGLFAQSNVAPLV